MLLTQREPLVTDSFKIYVSFIAAIMTLRLGIALFSIPIRSSTNTLNCSPSLFSKMAWLNQQGLNKEHHKLVSAGALSAGV